MTLFIVSLTPSEKCNSRIKSGGNSYKIITNPVQTRPVSKMPALTSQPTVHSLFRPCNLTSQLARLVGKLLDFASELKPYIVGLSLIHLALNIVYKICNTANHLLSVLVYSCANSNQSTYMVNIDDMT